VVDPTAVPRRHRDEVGTTMAPAFTRGRRGLFHLGGYLHSSVMAEVSDLSRMESRFVGVLCWVVAEK